MDDLQGIGQRCQQGHQPALVGRAAHLAQPIFQCHALVERHHHVGRAVGLPEAVDLQQRGVVELGQQTGFVDEAVHAGLEHRAVFLGGDHHVQHTRTAGQRGRHVLLDGHPALQRMVLRQVDDAEATFAQQLQQFELGQVGAHRQCIETRGLSAAEREHLGGRPSGVPGAGYGRRPGGIVGRKTAHRGSVRRENGLVLWFRSALLQAPIVGRLPIAGVSAVGTVCCRTAPGAPRRPSSACAGRPAPRPRAAPPPGLRSRRTSP